MPAIAEKALPKTKYRGLAEASLKAYFELVKPERTLVNVLTAAAGFFLASSWIFDTSLLVYTLLGTTLVIASGCVSNNLLDWRIDQKMKRTQGRVLATGVIGIKRASLLAAVIGLVGIGMLSLVNWLTFGLGILAFVSYVFVYGWAKRNTIWSTLIGTLPGGLSVVAGYTAVTDKIDLTALLLFLVLLAWQMAHFFAIAVFRRSDYKAAKLPIWSVERGIKSTRRQVIGFVVLFLLSGLALSIVTNSWLLAIALLLSGLWWLRTSLTKTENWARKSFTASLSVMLIFCASLIILPLF